MNVSVMQAKERLYELLGMLEDGEENQIIITRKGKPVAKIMDYYKDPEPAQRIGIAEGKFTVPDDLFDDDFETNNEELAKTLGVI